ncbi:MAG: hypothetical protein H0U75_08375 [Legionella sp.]|nr:hypothetical protein [Legionella sp.]
MVQEINQHFRDPQLVKIAPFTLGELPIGLDRHYIIAAYVSYTSTEKIKFHSGVRSKFDYHFLLQNDDGYFSHRRGEGVAEKLDSEGELITIPERSKFIYHNKHEKLDYEFIGYLYVKANQHRLAHMQENQFFQFNTLLVPREIPIWEKSGDFSYSIYDSYSKLNRRLTFVNNSLLREVKEIGFLGYKNHRLTMSISFKDLDICNNFLDNLPKKILSNIDTYEEKIYIFFTSQKEFDGLLECFHKLYPLSSEILGQLPQYLNTRIPQRITESDWLQSYPAFNSNFTASINTFSSENCLSYALTMRKKGPSLFSLSSQSSKEMKLDYVAKEINYYFTDNNLAIVATHEAGKLPLLKPGYSIISLHYSNELGTIQVNDQKYYQIQDFHFLVQNNDGGFSHRRGTSPERVDSNGDKINSPESAKLFYSSDALFSSLDSEPPNQLPVCMNYDFTGYLYLKTTETRLDLPLESFHMLDELDKCDRFNPSTKLSQFKGSFFLYPPLPEFFKDAQEKIKEAYSSITNIPRL